MVAVARDMATRRLILPAMAAMAVLALITINFSSPRKPYVLLERSGSEPAKTHDAQEPAKQAKTAQYHGMETGKSREKLDSYFESIPVYHVNAYHEMGKGDQHSVSTLSAKGAQAELDSYFDKIPNHDVDAYHEAKAKWHGEKFETEESRKALKQYFNRKAMKLHSNFHRVTAADAKDDLLSYYDSIPTSKVNAFHESQMLVPSSQGKKKEEGAKQAFKELSSYFDSIPTHSVNAFHEQAKRAHVPMPAHDYGAKKAFSDLSDYFSGVPTHDVNAFHESASALASEGVEQEEQERKEEERREEASEERAERAQQAVHKALAESSEANSDVTEQRARNVQKEVHRALVKAENERTGKAPSKFSETLDKEMTVGLGLKGDEEAAADASPAQAGTAGAKHTAKKAAAVAAPVRVSDFANLNDDAGPDPDAPTPRELQLNDEGYDTQYGLTKRLAGTVTIEKTPSGPVTSRLTTHKREAEAEAEEREAKEAAEAKAKRAQLAAWEERAAEMQAARQARLRALAVKVREARERKAEQRREARQARAEALQERVRQLPRADAEADWAKLAAHTAQGKAAKAAVGARKMAAHGKKKAAGVKPGMKVAEGQKMAAMQQHSLARGLGKAAAPLLCNYAGMACGWV